MGEFHNDRDSSDLDWSIRYAYDVIANKIMSERKTDMVGVMTFNKQGGKKDI